MPIFCWVCLGCFEVPVSGCPYLFQDLKSFQLSFLSVVLSAFPLQYPYYTNSCLLTSYVSHRLYSLLNYFLFVFVWLGYFRSLIFIARKLRVPSISPWWILHTWGLAWALSILGCVCLCASLPLYSPFLFWQHMALVSCWISQADRFGVFSFTFPIFCFQGDSNVFCLSGMMTMLNPLLGIW